MTTATPKYRPSFSLPQLLALETALLHYKETMGAESYPLEMLEVEQSIRIFLAKIGVGAKSPAYVATLPSAARKSANLLEELGEFSAPVFGATTIEECASAYKTYLATYKPFGLEIPSGMKDACTAWETYCTENDLNPELECLK